MLSSKLAGTKLKRPDMVGSRVKTLFLDIGGVLLTNGWGKDQRASAVAQYGLDEAELEDRHHLAFPAYEEGSLSLSEYLGLTVFYKKREFAEQDFIAFMLEQSKPLQASIDFFTEIKKQHKLKVVAVSNEGRELNLYRISKYKLHALFDTFISSSFVHLRKPDPRIFATAIDISQATKEECIYIDDRLPFVEIAQALGLSGIHHTNLEMTRERLEQIGLSLGT